MAKKGNSVPVEEAETPQENGKFFYPDHQMVVEAPTKEEADEKINKLITNK